MDEDTLLTLLVVSFSCDEEVLRLSVASRSTGVICAPVAEAANHRNLCRRLAVLREHTGGNSTAEWRAEDDARDFEFWATHVGSDWDFSDS